MIGELVVRSQVSLAAAVYRNHSVYCRCEESKGYTSCFTKWSEDMTEVVTLTTVTLTTVTLTTVFIT